MKDALEILDKLSEDYFIPRWEYKKATYLLPTKTIFTSTYYSRRINFFTKKRRIHFFTKSHLFCTEYYDKSKRKYYFSSQ